MAGNAVTQIYLSPHLDDAVYSCGGMINRQVQSDGRVVVVTLCAGDPPAGPVSDFALSLHERWHAEVALRAAPAEIVRARRSEDLAALAALGAQAVHLDAPDCIYRLNSANAWPMYTSEAAIIGPLNPAELTLIRRLATKLTNLLHGFGRHHLYVPLGIGQHVDHQLTRRAAEVVGGVYAYYEDFPYAARESDHSPSPEAAGPHGRTLTPELIHLSEVDVTARVQAMALYKSQLTSFWTSPVALDEAVRKFTNQVGGQAPAERIWRVG
jgi:LmbE family N-acetylglucosaminyl deacetylase